MAEDPRRISVVLFDSFELLDVFGPVELFSVEYKRLAIEFVGPTAGPVRSNQGIEVLAQVGYSAVPSPDIVLVPGGMGTRTLVDDDEFLSWLHDWSQHADLITSVCTGSAVLAAAGLLDGHRATSNKWAFDWAREQGPATEWVPEARWVVDGNRWTSSGVAAGMDMAAAVIAELFGAERAQRAADLIELEVHTDPSWDPFAAIHGAV